MTQQVIGLKYKTVVSEPAPQVIDIDTDMCDIDDATYFFNPYAAHPKEVKWTDFADARLYGKTAGEGFRLQRSEARREYNHWIHRQRTVEGWRYFKVSRDSKIPSYTPDHNPTFVISPKMKERLTNMINEQKSKEKEELQKSLVSGLHSNRGTGSGSNRQGRLIASSKTKGKSIYDDGFVAKMYTHRMGQRIAQKRNEMGLTQEDLALKVGVDAKTIANIERGGCVAFNPSDIMTRSLGRVLGFPNMKYEE